MLALNINRNHAQRDSRMMTMTRADRHHDMLAIQNVNECHDDHIDHSIINLNLHPIQYLNDRDGRNAVLRLKCMIIYFVISILINGAD